MDARIAEVYLGSSQGLTGSLHLDLNPEPLTEASKQDLAAGRPQIQEVSRLRF